MQLVGFVNCSALGCKNDPESQLIDTTPWHCPTAIKLATVLPAAFFCFERTSDSTSRTPAMSFTPSDGLYYNNRDRRHNLLYYLHSGVREAKNTWTAEVYSVLQGEREGKHLNSRSTFGFSPRLRPGTTARDEQKKSQQQQQRRSGTARAFARGGGCEGRTRALHSPFYLTFQTPIHTPDTRSRSEPRPSLHWRPPREQRAQGGSGPAFTRQGKRGEKKEHPPHSRPARQALSPAPPAAAIACPHRALLPFPIEKKAEATVVTATTPLLTLDPLLFLRPSPLRHNVGPEDFSEEWRLYRPHQGLPGSFRDFFFSFSCCVFTRGLRGVLILKLLTGLSKWLRLADFA